MLQKIQPDHLKFASYGPVLLYTMIRTSANNSLKYTSFQTLT